MLVGQWWLKSVLLAVLGPTLLAMGVSATDEVPSRDVELRSPAATATPPETSRCLVR
ncbi:hypothetical protein [Thermasporomyces composti]|jgi:hypothetical protein|uniref:Uncharacterized protein n=1 Tax=Thermasporomyces composti TaxID=696763 RepID=A0A3D9V2B7_THECX|nr:hypothetical protein [Thermasporomyces composti]REF35932.1 hypothetical protein DFJ64_1325 [Thermasporomyces composti]